MGNQLLDEEDSEVESSNDEACDSVSRNLPSSVQKKDKHKLQESGVALSQQALILLKQASRSLRKRRRVKGLIVAPLYRQLKSLRKLVPYSSPAKESCVISDALNYLRQLKQEINDLHDGLKQSDSLSSLPPQDVHLSTVEVINVNQGLRIYVSCQKRPGLMADLMVVLETAGLVFDEVNASCHNSLTIDAFTTQKGVDAIDKKAIRRGLLRAIYNN